MSENALKETVIRLAEPVVRSLGLVIWGVEVVQAGRMAVRLFVDVPSGAPESPQAADGEKNEAPSSASIGQCEEISRHLGLALEVEDAVPSAYVLEVSTPGLTRLFFSLDQMRPYLGDMVEARLHVPVARKPPRDLRIAEARPPAASGAAGSPPLRRTPLCWNPPRFPPKGRSAPRVCRPCACPGRLCAGPAACIFSASR